MSSISRVIAANTYTYDNLGNRVTNEAKDGDNAYTYDSIYRLTETYSTERWKNQESYSYDAVGNRLSSRYNSDFEYNTGNQLLNVFGVEQYRLEGQISFTYDQNGNMTAKNRSEGRVTTYLYDYLNRLKRIERAGTNGLVVVEYKYDPFGRRIEISVAGGDINRDARLKVTSFFYDNEDILFEYDAAGVVGNRYVHGPGIDEPLAVEQKRRRYRGRQARGSRNSSRYRRNTTYYYHADGLGSIIALTDKRERVVQSYIYNPFGRLLHNYSTRIEQPYTYTGREWDKDARLYFYRARYYDAEVGRFITRDPIGFAGGDMNLYGYVGNNPVNWVDPWGLYGEEYASAIGDPGQTKVGPIQPTIVLIDCSYYEKRYKETGDIYYGFIAPFACSAIRIPYISWDQCTRKCLQDYDSKVRETLKPNDCNYTWDDFTTSHALCLYECM